MKFMDFGKTRPGPRETNMCGVAHCRVPQCMGNKGVCWLTSQTSRQPTKVDRGRPSSLPRGLTLRTSSGLSPATAPGLLWSWPSLSLPRRPEMSRCRCRRARADDYKASWRSQSPYKKTRFKDFRAVQWGVPPRGQLDGCGDGKCFILGRLDLGGSWVGIWICGGGGLKTLVVPVGQTWAGAGRDDGH